MSQGISWHASLIARDQCWEGMMAKRHRGPSAEYRYEHYDPSKA